MIMGNQSEKDQLHPAARAVIKLALLASFFILIRIAMPYSDNGRLIGKVLCAASVLGVFCLDVVLHPSIHIIIAAFALLSSVSFCCIGA